MDVCSHCRRPLDLDGRVLMIVMDYHSSTLSNHRFRRRHPTHQHPRSSRRLNYTPRPITSNQSIYIQPTPPRCRTAWSPRKNWRGILLRAPDLPQLAANIFQRRKPQKRIMTRIILRSKGPFKRTLTFSVFINDKCPNHRLINENIKTCFLKCLNTTLEPHKATFILTHPVQLKYLAR